MKFLFFSAVFLFISFIGFAQTTQPAGNDSVAYTFAEVMPSFPDPAGFSHYLASNVKYPYAERDAGKSGVVYISFVVEKDGSISNVRAVKEVPDAPGFTKEAIRVISQMPNWKPGMMRGKPVRIEVTQPIRFVLNGGTSTTAKVEPSFPGGNSVLKDYLKQNLVYPSKEKKKHKEGSVTLSFTVATDGSISDVQIVSEVKDAPGFTKEALRLVKAMPKWKPGTINGLVSPMSAYVTVDFVL
jgi:TonB family protein